MFHWTSRVFATTVSPVATAAAAQKFSFSARYDALTKDPDSLLSGTDYAFLMEALQEYKSLQGAHGVKQSEIERTRRVANYVGLDMPTPHRRAEVKSPDDE